MQIQSIGAQRAYGLAKTALAQDGKGAGVSVNAHKDQPGAIAKGLESFEQVFQTVETSVQNYAMGKSDAQTVVESLAQAEMALEAAVTIRNRVVEAYQEILRMPL